MPSIYFIMNPCAGTKKANKLLPQILSTFNRAGFEVSVYITEARGDAARAASEKGAKFDHIVCCGGDGTFNEVLSGTLRAGLDIPIGYIPAGSTNDFAKSLRLPTDILEAAKSITAATPEYYDVGRFGDRYFSYVASFGAFTRTSYATPQSVKNALGHTAYILSGISELSQIRNIHARLELDGDPLEGDYLFGAICNSTSVGGILTLDPNQVDMRDGKFEIMLVQRPKNLSEIGEMLQAIQNKTYTCRMITFRSASKVHVVMDPNVDWTLDGEHQTGITEVDIINCHRAFRLLKGTV